MPYQDSMCSDNLSANLVLIKASPHPERETAIEHFAVFSAQIAAPKWDEWPSRPSFLSIMPPLETHASATPVSNW